MRLLYIFIFPLDDDGSAIVYISLGGKCNGTEGNGVVSVTSHHVFSLFLEELQFRGAEQVDGRALNSCCT